MFIVNIDFLFWLVYLSNDILTVDVVVESRWIVALLTSLTQAFILALIVLCDSIFSI